MTPEEVKEILDDAARREEWKRQRDRIWKSEEDRIWWQEFWTKYRSWTKTFPQDVLKMLIGPAAPHGVPIRQDVPPVPTPTPTPRKDTKYPRPSLAPAVSDGSVTMPLPTEPSGRLSTHVSSPLAPKPPVSLTMGEPMITAIGTSGEPVDKTIYPGSGRKVATIGGGAAGPVQAEEIPAWAKALSEKISAMADSSDTSLGLISEQLKRANERGTQRSPLVALPPRGSDVAFLSRSPLLAQRRQAARSVNLSGNTRTLRSSAT